MKQLKYTRNGLLLLASILLSACFSDKGNYDYHTIGEATIENIPGVTDNGNRFVCLQNEVINLTPNVSYEEGTSESDYDYLWYRIPQTPQGAPGHYEQGDTLSQTKDLHYEVKDSPRNYYLVYKVVNKRTKAVSELKFAFIISSVSGWVVLDEDSNGKGDLSVIRSKNIVENGDGRIVKDYYSLNNDSKKMENTRFIGRCDKLSNLYVFSDQGAYVLDASTYKEKSTTFLSLFSSVSQPSIIDPTAEYYDPGNGNTEVLVNNGKVYLVAFRMMGQTQFNAASTKESYTAAPNIAPNRLTGSDNCAVLFDTKANRFMTIGIWGTMSFPSSIGGTFSVQDIEPSLKYLYLGEGKDGETCLLMNKMENDVKQTYLYRVNLTSTTPVAIAQTDLTNLPDISEATHFTFGTRGNFLLYATRQAIYRWSFGEATADKLLSFSGDETIDQLKLYVNPSDNNMTGKIIFIATHAGNSGNVYEAKINEMSGTITDTPIAYKGFHKIKDMFYNK